MVEQATLRVRQPGRRPLRVVLDGELEVGRECDGLLLLDGEVSRRHARFRPVGDAVEVADLGSTNGTFVDGARLTEPRLLTSGSVVSLGATNIVVEATGSSQVGAAGRLTTVHNPKLRMTSIDAIVDSVVPHGRPQTGSEDSLGPTTTIMFTDIESSTERANAMGDRAWFALLEEHNSIFRSCLQAYGGKEIKTIGDAFMLAFTSVHQALGFAIEVQRRIEAPSGPDLSVRIGLHTGEAISNLAGDLFGRHVTLAARIGNLAGGGEIVASAVVRQIATVLDDVVFGPPMAVQLKGFAEPETVHEVEWR